ncbi:unnamed protein product [Psylliodes chrysocephalus]|uniref:Tetratricopeptide repeat protein 18 n=1 Tax=Psylliodes chrysocephalus TaxID=3402493 RepID=A0A9P0CG87_9CUCU|nr:unnamed protein product [Psylliodes chrysocephala]
MGTKVESKPSSTFKSITSKHSVIRSRTSMMRELNLSTFREKHAKIKITLECCQNLKPFFQFSDIQAKCVFGDNVIGESTPVPITDAHSIPIMHTFEFQIRRTHLKDMDNLVTFPAFLYFYQIQGTYDRHIYPQLHINELVHSMVPIRSFDSIFSLYEALSSKTNVETVGSTGDVPTVKRKSKVKVPAVSRSSSIKVSDKMGKSKKESKTLIPKEKRSSTSKISINCKKTSSISLRQSNGSLSPIIPCEPIMFGICTIDFLPLLFGNKNMSLSVLIKPVVEYDDEKMISYKSHPKATITLCTEDHLEVPDSAILNFTVETIYNIPQNLMKDNQEFKLCCLMPMLNEQKVPILFSNPVFLRKTTNCIRKCWPGIQRIGSDANSSEYRTPEDLKDLNVKFDPNVVSYINMDSVRLQFAMIKRHLLSRDSLDDIATHVKAHKKFVLEFYMTTKGAQPEVKTPKNHEPSVSTKKGTSFNPYLHLMALIDLSPLLYPGVRRVRVATPLTTFSSEDAAKYGGLEDSYFFPNAKENSKPNKVPGETERTTKEEKVTKGAEENLKYKLPFRPEEAADPVQVYDEEGRPCFVVVEIVLTTPLTPKKDIEVLKEDLSKLIVATSQVPQDLSKVILTSCITVDYYKEVLNGMVNDLNKKYLTYLEEQNCSTVRECCERNIESFVQYLKKRGVYESYVNSISKAVSLLISKKFHLSDNKNDVQYQKLIGDVFVFLISQMNETVNKLICHGMEPTSDITQINNYLFYSKEAMEIGRVEMAQRYLLERICHDTENADYWFDYGIFLLRNKEDDKAFESFKEALTKNANHKYCLLILGILLCEKSQIDDAETCLLVLMNKEFSWLEGWGVLYLFYLKCDNFEGMDMAMDMAKKHSGRSPHEQDEFMEADELVWTKAICPGTIFFRTAVLLLKCRLYEWCELALSQEVNNNSGLVQYLLSVICYYKKLYDHALDHIEETKRIYGPDYAVASLAGHCFLALDRKQEAKEQYYWALEFFNRPVSMHLVSIQLANILNEFGEIQEARKLALISCKYNPTPYTWMLAGKFYLQQNDLLSAEDCFSEGNCIDNRFAEIWGYLALVNAKLKRASEAEICYNQALRNKLDQQDLITAILDEVGTLSKEDFLHVY